MLVFPDIRLAPSKWFGQRFEPGGVDYKSVEELLRITAGDPETVLRKYLGPWIGQLPGKVWMASNQVPNFNDAVLPTRFIKVAFTVSYLGREDNNLSDRLLGELSGIAGRCLRAYHRARDRERFIQPRSAQMLEAQIAQSSDPFTEFVQGTFIPDPAGTVSCGKVFSEFQSWCARHGRTELLDGKTTMNIRKFINAVPGFEKVTRGPREHGKPRRYSLMRLRKAEDTVEEED